MGGAMKVQRSSQQREDGILRKIHEAEIAGNFEKLEALQKV